MDSRFPDGDYEQGIDFLRYIDVLRRRWPLILVATVLAAASAFLFSVLQAPTYEATALVVMGKPRYVLNFDELIGTPPEMTIQGSALATLATGDQVLRQVLSETQELLAEEDRTLAGLKEMVKATPDRDPGLLKLTVRGTSPPVLREVVNAWARLFVAHANRVYGISGENVSFFEVQKERARGQLDEAEQNLVAYQAQNELPVLEAQQFSLLSLQAQYLAEQGRIEGLLQDMETLRAQLGEQPATTPLTFDDQLAVLGLSLRSFSSQPYTLVELPVNDVGVLTGRSLASIPIQLQVSDVSVLTGRSRAEALTYLETLQENLRAKQVDLDTRLADLGPSLQELQERIESLRAREDRLEGARDQARTTYSVMVSKLEEARIAVEDTANRARVASNAEPPEEPVAPRPFLNSALAAMVGLMIGVGGAFVLEYPKGERQPVGVRDRGLAPEEASHQAGKHGT